jgi:hypothetical protein
LTALVTVDCERPVRAEMSFRESGPFVTIVVKIVE